MKDGAIKMIRKAALQVGAAALLALMAWNAYLAVNHSQQMQNIAARILESSTIQAGISGVLKDLTDMETGQRGYLLTGDPTYLQPYIDAKGRIGHDIAGLRVGLANRAESERSQELQLESLATAKQGEMERSISLRQQGYRHRAFMLVDSNEGMEYMNRAREVLSWLSVAENSILARLDSERNATLGKALTKITVANSCLFVLTICLFGLVRYHEQVLERETTQSVQALAVRDLQLERLMSALSNQARFKTSAIEANARLLLDNYGGFLPRQGHEYAEQIKEASAEMELLRQTLVDTPSSRNGVIAA
jgi:CHASE3 domain sensor protein